MPTASTATREGEPRYRPMFPDWSAPRPLSFFFLEELLEARTRSTFPTGAEEDDEDVNIYLADLLTRTARLSPGETAFGSQPQWHPPAKALGRKAQARWYRKQGEQRLLHLGLFGRGEGQRRRADLWGMTPEETRRRDLICGQACYEAAATLLARGRHPVPMAATSAKVARHFPRYVNVLETLGRGRWDLGARLSRLQLEALIGEAPADGGEDRDVTAANDRDHFLDALSRFRRRPSDEHRSRVLQLAGKAGIDPRALNL